MKNIIIFRHLIALRESYWFIPMIMIAFSFGLAAVVVQIDRTFDLQGTALYDWAKNLGPDGVRTVFTIIASSTITVSATIFSISIVVIVMASSQFGPRLIPTFMRYGKIQFGIGLFVGTFAYSLLMLTFVPADNAGELLPVWGIVVGITLGIVAFMVLIMLIHEIATFVQAPIITQRVSEDIIDTFNRVFPAQNEDESGSQSAVPEPEVGPDPWQLSSAGKGYVTTIDYSKIVELAANADCVVFLRVRPGEYVIRDQQLALVNDHEGVPEELGQSIRGAIETRSDRNLSQDALYAIDQMVQIAVRALSQGINDPSTAINCVDKLCSALAHLSRRRIALNHWHGENGQIHLVTRPETYAEIVEAAFGQIRHYAQDSPSVLLRIIESIGRLKQLDLHPDMVGALHDQLKAMDDTLSSGVPIRRDRERLQQRYRDVAESFAMTGNRVTES